MDVWYFDVDDFDVECGEVGDCMIECFDHCWLDCIFELVMGLV